MKPIFTFLIAISLFASTAHSQWNKCKGLYGGTVTCFAENGTSLFAGTEGGIFRTTDNGETWKDCSAGLKRIDIKCIIAVGNKMYAGVSDYNAGLYCSSNNGDSWENVSAFNNKNVGSFASVGDTLLVGNNTGVYRTTDEGKTWKALLTGNIIKCLGMIGKYIYAAIENEGLMSSSDYGKTWVLLKNKFPAESKVNCIYIKNSIIEVV